MKSLTTTALWLLTTLVVAVGDGCANASLSTDARQSQPLLGKRVLTFVSVIRVNQIEVSRDRNVGEDEGNQHTVEGVRSLRDNFGKAFPGGRMTWAFSWLALHDQRENYQAIRQQVVEYHRQFGDEITFIPGAYFAPMYNSREQVNRDLHDALKLVSEMVGGGYRPQCVIAGFLAAENQRYLAEQEKIHVCQGAIWSQYGIDNGDGDGSISYPYYPSREHYCKPAQGAADFIDCVCLDGWTCDFLTARRPGFAGGFNSRQGLGPIETLMNLGSKTGLEEQVFTTALHFDDGFQRNGFGWATVIWEVVLGTNTFKHLPAYGDEVRRRWPEVQCLTEGEFGEAFRSQFKDNRKLDYRFVERGSGIHGSETNLEIRWFMNRDFRLALLHDWTLAGGREKVIDFTRYDLKATEPKDFGRNWSLMNRINQKGVRPQDQPVFLPDLPEADQVFIRRRLPELFDLEVINGDFSDLTGLTPDNDGWYSGLPKGWTGSGDKYTVNVKSGTTPPVCNPSRLGRLSQAVGTLEKTSDIVLAFDVSDVFNGETVLTASILDGDRHLLASGEFTDGDRQKLVAKQVPAGTAICILFQATQSTPALDNVSVAVWEPGSVADKPRAATNAPITVAAYYYACTHPDPRWDKNKYPGYTEWDEIIAAKPRFPGHIQPKPPVWGYQNEAKPEVMAQKIAAAADYGVNAFIFDWYYYNDGPYLEGALEEGFLRATNNARVKFALMWANHDWCDIQGYNPADNNLKLLYPGKVTPATWDKICDLVIARYFKHPSYWLVAGKPYFSIYEMSQFLDSFGSIENARAALDQFRAKVRAAGFPDLHVNAIVWGEPNLPGGKTPPGWPKLCRDLALDSLTSYTWVHHGALNYSTFPVSDYLWGRQKYLSFWARAKTDYPIPYFPNAMICWDNSPRAAANADWSKPGGHVVTPVVTGNTPAAFKQSLEIIKQRLLAAPTQPKIVTINAWNEWPEGSCLEPMQPTGYGYLEAVKAVFAGAK